ncbi:DUF1758 domain-containing protein [Trichonephila clavata]|uniref:DUF1758 domain-containing protein n=1 Tax=Trichonephila clavata TaxID=2740835 RepID=A0A8X6KX73_TRICU|nr:DUF1758 domain-containing protein [Trichonephila clavata]
MCLSNIQKLQYLRGLLLSEPANIIKHIPITETAYNEAWEKLLARYDKKKQIMFSLIKTFMEQPSFNDINTSNLRNIADTSDEVIRGLKSIDTKAESRDVWLIYILLQKVDSKTRQEWAQFSNNIDFPTFESFIEFLNNRCTYLELYNESVIYEKQPFVNKSKFNNNFKCSCCKMNHLVFKCLKFKEMSVKERKQFVNKQKLCMNCLSDKHTESHCNSTFTCHFCKKRHHSLLYDNNFKNYAMSSNKSHHAQGQNQIGNDTNPNKTVTASVNSMQKNFSLLPTIRVNIKNILGENCQVRVMTDSGSESTFISEKCLKLLGLKRKNARLQIRGLQDSNIAMTKGCVEMDLVSLHDPKVKLPVKAYVLEKLTAPLPMERINETHFSHLKNACLADPNFFIPNDIDMILGSDYFFSILLPGQITCAQSNLIAQNSIFGFLISGKLTESLNVKSMLNLHINGTSIDNQLKQFWELEEIPNLKDRILTSEEQFVETHFQNTYTFNSDGRFVVKLPFYKSNLELGDSKPAAISRLLAMERKFKNNLEFEKQYKEFMNEYESLGHMSLVKSNSHTFNKLADLAKLQMEDIYMDDLLFGSDTPNNAISICKDIVHVLSTRGLRKWNSNSTEFISQFSEHSSHDTRVEFSKDSNESSKVLVFMKIFYQKLWLTKTDWDSPIPQQLTDDWLKFQKAFNEINYLTVPRWVILTSDNTVELHGFADASSLAYAAAIYCRQKHNGKIKVQLLVSKTKVAPIKQVSIPRLEFHPRKWKTFVANKTSEIIEVLPTKHWRNVPSKENPVDITSRGIDPKYLPEGLLNSRPLSYVNNSDIKCISTLTPSHFLTGDVLPSVPEELPSTSNHINRWELLQNVKRGFWKKWSYDFLSLQPRKKWQIAQPNLKEDDIVLIKEEGPPGTWPMARVLQVHPGNDGLVRVATVKT